MTKDLLCCISFGNWRKNLFSVKPILMQAYKGNAFITTNAIIHDLKAGCTYGTTWSPNLQDFTKVCFVN
ncbi:hypothetical protein CBG25_16000 [Arsenophonus sp. ENCA]|nr:hypothetical protein CBG25_16000 [Arsenophonus sp. ENCA]